MEVSRIRALRGPNLWSKNTAIEAIVSCADAECSIDNLPEFEARLRARMPLVVGMTACSAGQSNNFRYKPIDYRVVRAAGV